MTFEYSGHNFKSWTNTEVEDYYLSSSLTEDKIPAFFTAFVQKGIIIKDILIETCEDGEDGFARDFRWTIAPDFQLLIQESKRWIKEHPYFGESIVDYSVCYADEGTGQHLFTIKTRFGDNYIYFFYNNACSDLVKTLTGRVLVEKPIKAVPDKPAKEAAEQKPAEKEPAPAAPAQPGPAVPAKPAPAVPAQSAREASVQPAPYAPAEKPGYIFCRKCGRKLPADSLFCTYCGTEVKMV